MSKGLEALEKLYPKTTYMPYYTRSEKRAFCKIIEKELKALEIMKTKLGIEEEDFFYDDVLGYMFVGNVVSKEEYDLLKEVLL